MVKKEAEELVNSFKEFGYDSVAFLKKCNKPDKKEFLKIASACSLGFLVMGVIGFLIKLLFIPINNILLS